MGKIDLNAKRREMQMKEIDTPVNEALQSSYENVWGRNKETIENIELTLIKPYRNKKGKKQPFKLNKEKVLQIKTSAKDIGIITPLIIRKTADGYQILSGHHRFQAAKELGLLTVPCVIRNVSDEDADKYVVEANIQRVKLLPSEYGAIFDRYMEIRKDIELTAEEIAEKFGVSKKNLYRYMNVNKLSVELQDLIDNDRINIDCPDLFVTLNEEQQKALSDALDETEVTVTLSQAKKIMELFESDNFSKDNLVAIYEKPTGIIKNKLYKSFGKSHDISGYTEEELDNLVVELLDEYFKKKV